MSKGLKILLIILSLVWFIAQLPAVFYGTQKLALHMSYVGDEQAPINGALKMLQEKSLFGMRNAQTVYYGPIFSIIALPAVVADFSEKFLFAGVRSASDYRDYILWNWGGIVWKARLISVLFSFLSLLIVFKLFCTKTFNPSGNKYLPLAVAILLSTNFLFFEYGHFFRHWTFVLFSIVGMLYSIVRLHETGHKKYYAYSLAFTVFGFGVSYLNIMFLTAWIPLLVYWVVGKKYNALKRFFAFSAALIFFLAVIVVWNPHPFLRIAGLSGGDIINVDTSSLSTEKQKVGHSFSYYSRIILNNELPLVIVLVVLIITIVPKVGLHKKMFFTVTASALVPFFVIFGIISHHESRYVLPTMLLLIILIGGLAGQYLLYKSSINRYVTLSLVALTVFAVLYNSAVDIALIKVWNRGPKEVELIKELQDFQKTDPTSKTLVAKHYLLGAPHTKDAYMDYMKNTNKTKVNLYNVILEADYHVGATPLSVYYVIPPKFELNRDIIEAYKHIVYYYEFNLEQGTEPDYFDVDTSNLFIHQDLSDSYYFIK